MDPWPTEDLLANASVIYGCAALHPCGSGLLDRRPSRPRADEPPVGGGIVCRQEAGSRINRSHSGVPFERKIPQEEILGDHGKVRWPGAQLLVVERGAVDVPGLTEGLAAEAEDGRLVDEPFGDRHGLCGRGEELPPFLEGEVRHHQG